MLILDISNTSSVPTYPSTEDSRWLRGLFHTANKNSHNIIFLHQSGRQAALLRGSFFTTVTNSWDRRCGEAVLNKEQKRGDVQQQQKQHLKLAKREGGRKILLPVRKARKTIALSHEAKK